MVQAAFCCRDEPRDAIIAMGERWNKVKHVSDICKHMSDMMKSCACRDRPFYSVVGMADIIKREHVVPGFGLPDETSMFWLNQYAWVSGRSRG